MYACYVWKQWEIWLQNCKMDIKTMQCMWILNTNDAWKFFLVKYLKTENFQFRSIEHRSNTNRVRQTQTKNFNCSFDWSKNKFDRSKVWKIQNFEKRSNLMQKLLKAQYFMNEMHEYEIKSFSKTLEFNPDLPKSRFSINLSLKRKH